jgi:hypothetical protein
VWGAVDLKNLPWGQDREIFIAERHIARDIEAEFSKFSTEMISPFTELLWWDPAGVATLVISQLSHLQGTFLVSLNNARPKKKNVTLLDNKILFRRPGENVGEETSVSSHNLLIVAQRSGGIKTTTLTVFWRSLEDIKPPPGLETFKVESAEIFFDDVELLIPWQLGLGRLQKLAAQAMQMQRIRDESKPLLSMNQ